MRVDTRWDKPWGWNALRSTTRLTEVTTNTVISTITLHRRDSSANKYIGSAKSCDPEGSSRCLEEATRMGFDVTHIVHDNDSYYFSHIYFD